MSQTFKAILGALAVTTAFGAVQFASGQDLTEGLAGRFQALSDPPSAASIPNAAEINRTAKGDREPIIPGTAGPARTIMMKVDSLADTSILIRIPIEKEARNEPPAQPAAVQPAKGGAKRIVACEPVVSVLTEVAKLLQPGKCVT